MPASCAHKLSPANHVGIPHRRGSGKWLWDSIVSPATRHVARSAGAIYDQRDQAKGTGMAKEHIARFDSLCAETLCSLCGFEGEFIRFHPDSSLRETRCPQCASARRTRDVARVLLRLVNASTERPLCEQLSAFEDMHIFELQAAGPLHLLLKDLPHLPRHDL